MASSVVVQFPGNLSSVPTIAALRALPSYNNIANADVLVEGGLASGDGSGGTYVWNTGSLEPDDNSRVIRPNDLTGLQAGRWKFIGASTLLGAKASLAALKATPISENAPTLVTADGLINYAYVAGNFTGQADDAAIVKLDAVPLTTGALVRQTAASISHQDTRFAGFATTPTLDALKAGDGAEAVKFGFVTDDFPQDMADVRDCSSKMQTLTDAMAEYPGNRCLLPAGKIGLEQPVAYRRNTFLEGQGSDQTYLVQRGVTPFRVFDTDGDADGTEAVGLRGITFVGNLIAQTFPADGTGSQNLTEIGRPGNGYFARAIIEDVRVLNSTSMGLVVFAKDIYARHLVADRCYRDSFHLRCMKAQISDVAVSNGGDDALAVHLFAPTDVLDVDRQIQIDTVRVFKSLGVKVLGLRNGSIRNVNARFATQYGLFIGVDAVEGSAELDCLIDGVTAWDTIYGTYVGRGAEAAAVVLALRPKVGSPGKPETWINDVGPAIASGSSGGITINNVKSRQTLAGITKFSDSGYGKLWQVYQGEVDPAMTSTITMLNPGNPVDTVRVRSGAVDGLTIRDAQAIGGRWGVLFENTTTEVQNAQVHGGVFQRLTHGGIGIDPTGLTSKQIGLQVNQATFDLDPYLEGSGRQANGSWSGGDPTKHVGVYAPDVTGVYIRGGTLKNSRYLAHASPTSCIDSEGVVWVGDPQTLKGNGELLDFDRHRLDYVESDPSSPDYGKSKNATAANQDRLTSGAMPTGGWWARGQFVRNIAASSYTVDGSGDLLRGWRRLTTGNTHVLNTDWKEIKE